jgi:hypothetical protein
VPAGSSALPTPNFRPIRRILEHLQPSPRLGPRWPFFTSRRRYSAQSRPRFLVFPWIWALIHSASPGHPRSPRARSGTPDERKAGTGPLCRRENTQTLQSCRKSPSPSRRCSVATGTTPRQSVGRLPELCHPSSHLPPPAYISPFGVPSGHIPPSGNSSRRALSTRPAGVHPFA